MRIVALLLLLAAPAAAKTLNVEFKFTPYTGDPKEDHVQVVVGAARVFVNNVSIATENVEAHEVPVIFDEREIAPAVWVSVTERARAPSPEVQTTPAARSRASSAASTPSQST